MTRLVSIISPLRIRAVVLVVFAALFLILTGSVHAWPGKVVGVSDGDTITVLQPPRNQVKIRLYGIDTPEKRQTFGQRAKQFTSSVVFGEVVEVQEITRDRYGRTVAIVCREGKCLNEELVNTGFAWVYRRYCDREPLRTEWLDLEARARREKRGLWQDKNPSPPWEWRRGQRANAQVDPLSTSCLFRGNIKTFAFHRPECRHYDCESCTADFQTKEEALKAGYRPCRVCDP